jgi:lipoprotein-anchoring transpeptidase ErfK/SrfK
MPLLASHTGFRGLFAILALAGALAFAVSAQAEPQSPDPGTQSEASPTGEQTEPQPEGTDAESNPADAQPDSNPAGAQPPSEDAQTGAEAAPEEPASKVVITIDKTSQQMTVWVDGIEQYQWPVSTGRAGYSTPSGTYTPTSMNEMWYSKQWDNSPMPHAIFFMKDGHAIHGTHEVRNLGKPASHGCVRISPANAAILYDLVKEKGMKNTQVALTGETPGGEAKVASQPAYPRYGEDAPWFGPGQGYYPQPQRRRGLFGRWFQPDDGPQGYYRPRGYSYPPRGAQGY